ncbi:MAG: ammonium transporter [Lawsonibacter sp.]|nr:ammonium transporter [Lawsonibacter sp.]
MINAGDTAFVLICTALVCLMTPGLAFFYGGLVRKKNVLTIMMQSFISMGVVTLIWIVFGFSLAFGTDVHGVIGNFQFAFLNGVGLAPSSVYGPTIPFMAFFIFQLMFAVITPALITGAFADRFSFKSYLIFLVAWSLLVYIPIVHWVWGGGFLQQMGVIDFAGGLTVHASAGISALASAIFIGKRTILPNESTAPHDVTYVALGTGLLWFGWFGFNGGSALAANGTAAAAVTNTFIAGATAMVSWLWISSAYEKRTSLTAALTGAIAGCAVVTPGSGYVEPCAALVIGLAAGLVCYYAVRVHARLNLDDALDVWSVHGVGGVLGTLLAGVFAVKSVGGVDGLIAGNGHQFLVELVSVVIVLAYSFVVTFGMLKAINVFVPVRVSKEAEILGLDLSLHGEQAYGVPEDGTAPAAAVAASQEIQIPIASSKLSGVHA